MRDDVIAARFANVNSATAAIDWFTNQALPDGAMRIFAQQANAKPRPPKAGDNARTDVSWIVAVDFTRARMPKADVLATMRREGGAILSEIPTGI
jgi:hypothetical protein